MPWFVSINFEDGEIESSLRCVIKIYQKHPELSCTQVSRESSGKSPFLSVSRVWKPVGICSHFPGMRMAKGSRFTFWGLGVEMCSRNAALPFATVLNRPQPSATIRNRPQPSAMRVRWPCLQRVLQKWIEVVTCAIFKRGVTSCHNVSKAVFCDRRQTFSRFSEYELIFSWQGQQFRRVVLCVFRELSGLRQVVTTCTWRGRSETS
jgi:hypothetical protein